MSIFPMGFFLKNIIRNILPSGQCRFRTLCDHSPPTIRVVNVCHPEGTLITKEVIIEENTYIGAGVLILPGVRIGHHALIGAGSVVTRDIPPKSVAFGNPACVQGTVDEWLSKKRYDNEVNGSIREIQFTFFKYPYQNILTT